MIYNRWVELYTTSPSGKTLFVCRMCGQISPVPSKTCVNPPEVGGGKVTMPCHVLEEIAAAVHEHEGRDAEHIALYVSKTHEGQQFVQWGPEHEALTGRPVQLRQEDEKK